MTLPNFIGFSSLKMGTASFYDDMNQPLQIDTSSNHEPHFWGCWGKAA